MADEKNVAGSSVTKVLGVYFVLLGISLFYLTFIIWPPDFEVAVHRVNGLKEQKDVECPIVLPTFFHATTSTTPKPSASPIATAGPTLTPSPTATASPSPSASPGAGQANTAECIGVTNPISICISYDRRLLLLVIVIGALGSYIHVVSSFGDFVGNQTFTRSWIWWYLLRPFVGIPLALLFYFAIRAGILTAGASAGDVNRFGIAAVAGLVGMFSVTAADKLKEVFNTLFKTDVKRDDPLKNGGDSHDAGKGGGQPQNPKPSITSIEPKADILRILGSGFTKASRVLINGIERPSSDITLLSGNELTVARRKEEKGQVTISVSNPAPGGGNADSQTVNLEDV